MSSSTEMDSLIERGTAAVAGDVLTAPDGTGGHWGLSLKPLTTAAAAAASAATAGPPLPSRLRTLIPLWFVSFWLNCKPSEPYLAKYLMEWKGLSEDQLNHDVWPWSTYGALIFMLPVGLLAEVVGYRPTIFCGLFCRELTRGLLVFATGVFWMAVMQLTYAGSVAVNSIFFAYVYVVVEPQHYAVATAGIYASYHTGNFLASVLASVLVRHTAVARHLVTLFYLSWVSTSIACIVFVALVPKPIFAPPVSIFAILRGRSTAIDGQEQANVVHGGDLDRKFGFRAVVRELRSVYASRDVKLASLWMVLGNGSTGIGINIFQTYFYSIDPHAPAGLIEGALELLMATGAALLAIPWCKQLFQQRQSPPPTPQLRGRGGQLQECARCAIAPTLLAVSSLMVAALGFIGLAFGPTPTTGSQPGLNRTTRAGTGGSESSPYLAFVPIVVALGLSGAQEAISSVCIASALAQQLRGKQTTPPIHEVANDDAYSPRLDYTEHQVQGRYALVFPTNKLGELLVTSILTFLCGSSGLECTSTSYVVLWIAGHACTFAVMGIAMVSLR